LADPAALLHNCAALLPGAPFTRVDDAALLVMGDRIMAVGARETVASDLPARVRRVDLEGGLVLPGLTDAHCHLLAHAMDRARLDLRPVESLAQLVSAVASAQANEAGWVLGRGFDESRFPEGCGPDRRDLDVRANPVLLTRKDGHTVVANTAALAAMDITDAGLTDTAGGRVELLDDGTPSGVLREAAAALAHSRVPQETASAQVNALLRLETDVTALGIIGVHEMAGTDPKLAEVQLARWCAAAADGLTLRASVYLPLSQLEAAAGVGLTSGFGDQVRVGGVKLFLDGSLGSQTAHLLQPYPGERLGTGVATLTDDELRRALLLCRRAGLSPAMHAIGDAAVRRALDGVEEATRGVDAALTTWRPRIEHAQLVDAADMSRFQTLGVCASMQPLHCVADIALAETFWGSARCERAYAWRSLLDRGAALAFGSDAPVETIDPWAGMRAAISRASPGEVPWHAEQALTPYEALHAYTAGAAAAAGLNGVTGALRPGAWADLAVVDGFSEAADDWSEPRVMSTWIAGRRVWPR
jgi:predicted amidohydrolase YtcJ